MARVRDPTQGRFDVVPPSFVFQAATNEFGDEGASLSPSYTTVKVGHEFVIQRYV